MEFEKPGYAEEEQKRENPDEMIIFQDGNHPGAYFRGKRSEKQFLIDEGGLPIEERNPKLNELGQIWAPTEWDDTGNAVKLGWQDVREVPDHLKNGN